MLQGIKKFIYRLIFKQLENLNNTTLMSWRKFGTLKRYINEERSKDLCVTQDINGDFEIWHTYKGENKYGDKIDMCDQIGWYIDSKQKLYYADELKELIDEKYF